MLPRMRTFEVSREFSRLLLCVFFVGICGCATTATERQQMQFNRICEPVQAAPGRATADGRKSIDYDAPDTASYAIGTSAYDISNARGHLWNLRAEYEHFECEKEYSNRNQYDRPLLVTAIAAAVAALAKANPYVIGGIGLTAGGIATFKSYNHPDTDRDAFLQAYAQLTCAYDETHSLKYTIDVGKLIYDRQQLQAAMEQVSQELSKFPANTDKLDDRQKTIVKAADAALDAGNAAVKAAKVALDDYAKIATTIYRTVDRIDITARNANKTNGDYAAFGVSIKAAYAAAGKSDAAVDDAKKKVIVADATQEVAKDVKVGRSNRRGSTVSNAASSLISRSERSSASPASAGVSTQCAPGVPACQRLQVVNGRVVDSATSLETRAFQIANDSSTSDIERVIGLARITTDDLPTPSFADVIVNLTACVPKS